MKRLFLFITVLAYAVTGVLAQNANRKGLLVEVGAGGLVGDMMKTRISIVENEILAKCMSGFALDFSLGAQIPISNNLSYEAKGGMYFTPSDCKKGIVGRIMPIGFRYSSTEFWRNHSWYAHLNIGCAISASNGRVIDIPSDSKVLIKNNELFADIFGNINEFSLVFPNMREMPIDGDAKGIGLAYSLGVGLNITHRFYIELNCNMQSMFNCYGRNGKAILNGGMVGATLGYRFF